MKKYIIIVPLLFALLSKAQVRDSTLNLNIKYVSDQKHTIVFEAIYKNEKDSIYIPELGYNQNQIFVISPNGQLHEISVWESPVKPGGFNHRPNLGPNDTKRWELPVEILFDFINVNQKTEKGLYEIYWKIYGVKSNTIRYQYNNN